MVNGHSNGWSEVKVDLVLCDRDDSAGGVRPTTGGTGFFCNPSHDASRF